MEHKAVVLKTYGEKADVSVLREEACAHCAGRVVCGTAKRLTVQVKNPIGAKEGDTVTIERPSESVLFYSALVFLAPVLLAVVLYLCFTQINEIFGMIAAVLGFIAPFVAAMVIDRRAREDRLPVITEIAMPENSTPPCDMPDAEL